MDIPEALEIVRKLADGLDPGTGHAIRNDSLYPRPLAVQALNRAAQALEFQLERERSRRSLPANAGKPWTNSEEAQVCDELRRGVNFQEIARIHSRTAGSIVARLIRLGKISANANRSGHQPTKSA